MSKHKSIQIDQIEDAMNGEALMMKFENVDGLSHDRNNRGFKWNW